MSQDYGTSRRRWQYSSRQGRYFVGPRWWASRGGSNRGQAPRAVAEPNLRADGCARPLPLPPEPATTLELVARSPPVVADEQSPRGNAAMPVFSAPTAPCGGTPTSSIPCRAGPDQAGRAPIASKYIGRGGARTLTSITGHGILSPVRLPVPPLGLVRCSRGSTPKAFALRFHTQESWRALRQYSERTMPRVSKP